VAAQTARDLAASCSDRADSDFGPCIAAAAQALVDDAQQDQTVVAGARELVENCRAQVDVDFTQCIADGARAIGQAAANQLSAIGPGLATPSPVGQSAQITPIVEEPTATPPATATRAIQPVVAPGFPTALRGQQTITPPLQPAPPGLPSPRATQSEPGSPSP
jgi:hypothetical protein